jgi:hypothetical protein
MGRHNERKRSTRTVTHILKLRLGLGFVIPLHNSKFDSSFFFFRFAGHFTPPAKNRERTTGGIIPSLFRLARWTLTLLPVLLALSLLTPLCTSLGTLATSS